MSSRALHAVAGVVPGVALGLLLATLGPARASGASPFWAEVPPPIRDRSANPEYAHGSVYDPARQRMVIVGPFPDDIATLSLGPTPAWDQIATSGRPAATLAWNTAVLDPTHDRILVVGILYTADFSSNYLQLWALSLEDPPQWTLLDSPVHPPARYSPSAMLDPARHRLLVFGGSLAPDLTTRVPTNEILAYDLQGGSGWQTLSASRTPPAGRYGHSEIYDPIRDRMVVFGGWYNGPFGPTPVDETWALSLSGSPAWTFLAPVSSAPPARGWHSALYDPLGDRMLVFGGENASGTDLNDFWSLPLGTPGQAHWSSLSQPPLAGRVLHSAIYDQAEYRMVVYGGISQPDPLHSSLDMPRYDVWGYALTGTAGWSNLASTSQVIPPRGAPILYDPVRDRMLVLLGTTDFQSLRDSWALSLGSSSWARMSDAPTSLAGDLWAVYDEPRDRAIVLGVVSTRIELLSLSLATSSWSSLNPTGAKPDQYYGFTVTGDPVGQRLLLFGGTATRADYSVVWHNDVWALSLSGSPAWTQLDPSGTPPSPGVYFQSTYDPVRQRMLVFGGMDSLGHAISDVWALSLSGAPAWTLVPAQGEAPPGSTHLAGAVYDPDHDRALVLIRALVSAYDDSVSVWALSLSGTPTWTKLSTRGRAPIGRPYSMTYDPPRQRVLFFGGGSNETWSLDLSDVQTAVLVSLAGASAEPDRVTLHWYSGSLGLSASVYRRTAKADWGRVGAIRADGTGALTFVDHRVLPGHRYAYRLGLADAGREVFAGETWVDVPAAATLSLNGSLPNPVGLDLRVSFSLADASPASLELLDVAGRLVLARPVGDLGPGHHMVDLGRSSDLRPGLYFLRLRQGSRSVSAKVVVAQHE